MHGVISRGLQCPGEGWAQGSGRRGEAGCEDAHPLADHLDDAWGEVAHTVRAPLALMDVALPAAIGVLLKHLWQMVGSVTPVTSCIKQGQVASRAAAVQLSPHPSRPTVLPLLSASSPVPRVPPEHTNESPGVGPGLNPSSTAWYPCGLGKVTLMSLSLNFAISKKETVIMPTLPGSERSQ